jgi:hypothetical protein
MLKACPKIRTLDLTGCQHINEDLFFGDQNSQIITRLKSLIITNTGISSEVAALLKEKMKQLEFEETVLRITDAQLVDEQALEKILKSRPLNKLTCIDLQECQKLTNAMLGQLLDHLNADIWIKKDGVNVDNPQRLNLEVLNLTGCHGITDEAFHHQENKNTEEKKKQIEKPVMQDGEIIEEDQEVKPISDEATVEVKKKIQPKLLENLCRVVINGTKISDVLKEVYPQVIFQMHNNPVTIQIDLEAQLKACQAYLANKRLGEKIDLDPKMKKLAHDFIHNRIAVELFASEAADQGLVDMVLSQPIDTNAKEFSDISLMFKKDDNSDPAIIQTHREVLYSQAKYFMNSLRPGGIFSKAGACEFINQAATPQAVKVMGDLLYQRARIDEINWETAAEAAELIGTNNFKFMKRHYRALLHRMRSQFDLDNAEKMLLKAKQLEDEIGMQQYDKTLLFYLTPIEATINDNNEHQLLFRRIGNLAKGNGLQETLKKVNEIEAELTNKESQRLMDEQNAENERLSMLAAQQLANFA